MYRFLMVGLLIVCISCGRMISNRESAVDSKNLYVLSKFPISKEVEIDISHEYHFDFSEMRIVIMVNNLTVFHGSYEDLTDDKVKLPSPLSGGVYLICVRIIDPVKKVVYTWASDAGKPLLKNKMNHIKLLYTGTREESITLEVSHI